MIGTLCGNLPWDWFYSKVVWKTGLQFVMWSEKTCHMVQNWYLELLVLCDYLNYSLSRIFTWISSDTGIKSYWCSKAIKNKAKHKNYDANFLYFAVSPFATCDDFSQITSHFPSVPQSQKVSFVSILKGGIYYVKYMHITHF